MSLTQARLLTIIHAALAYRDAYESLASALDQAATAGEGTQAQRDFILMAYAQIPTQRLDLLAAHTLLLSEADRLALRAGKARRERERLARRKAERQQPTNPYTDESGNITDSGRNALAATLHRMKDKGST